MTGADRTPPLSTMATSLDERSCDLLHEVVVNPVQVHRPRRLRPVVDDDADAMSVAVRKHCLYRATNGTERLVTALRRNVVSPPDAGPQDTAAASRPSLNRQDFERIDHRRRGPTGMGPPGPLSRCASCRYSTRRRVGSHRVSRSLGWLSASMAAYSRRAKRPLTTNATPNRPMVRR